MGDSNNLNLYSDEEMYLDGFKYDEIVGMLGPGLDNNFLDSVMGDLDAEENLLEPSLESTPLPFQNQLIEDEQENKIFKKGSSGDVCFSNSPVTSNLGIQKNTINCDPLLTQPIVTEQNIFNNNNFPKTETARTVLSQIVPLPNSINVIENVKPVQTVTQSSQPHTILLSSPNYCNIKPAPRVLPATTNITQFQNVKPITIQSNVSVVPQVVAVQSLTKDNQIFVQSPTLMYTTAKVQQINTVPQGTQAQNTFQNGNTLVFLDTADNKGPIHRVSLKNGKRVGKRLAHNATEKKYRLSISSGIESLKNLVVGEDAKLQKSAILRKAVDYILSLQKQNRELRRQNAELVKAAKIGNVKELLLPSSNDSIKSEHFDNDSYNPMTPPRSDVSNPSSSPSYSDNSLPSSPYSTKDDSDTEMAPRSRGMPPHQSLTLCVFMFAVMVFNPFGSLLTKFSEDDDSSNIASRTSRGLLSEDDLIIPWQNIGLSLSMWLLNIFLLLICLIKILIYGDPILPSSSNETFQKHKKHVEVEYGKGNGSGAYRELIRCLQSYGQFLPTTKRECFFATSWQFIRMILHQLWIGKFLSRKAGGLFCSVDKRIEALNSAKELSLVYHRLNQINLSTNMEDSHGLLLSLSAINMAEAAASVMNPENLIEIYMTAALRVKKSYPRLLQFFSRYYLNKAKMESSKLGNKIPIEFQWLLTPYGYRFFLAGSFDYSNTLSDESIFSVLGNKADPMSFVTKAYREHLLEKSFQCLIGTGLTNSSNLNSNSSRCRISDVLNYTQLLIDSIINESSVSISCCTFTSSCCKDRLAHWWASLLSSATYWILGEKETAEKMFAQIQKPPNELIECSDTLPKCFFKAFLARKAVLNRNGFSYDNVYSVCNSSTVLLQESLKSRNVKGMNALVQFLACNWLLETRTTLWEVQHNQNEKNCCFVAAPSSFMVEFQKDLNSLRIITENITNADSRVFLYEAVYRLMAGAAPGPTHELLNRNMTYRQIKSSIICSKDRHEWDNGEREKADAIFIANKYLPTNLFSDSRVRRGLLIEAINILEKIGDKNKLDECNQLLSSIGTSVSN